MGIVSAESKRRLSEEQLVQKVVFCTHEVEKS